jgi:hypothetical protein
MLAISKGSYTHVTAKCGYFVSDFIFKPNTCAQGNKHGNHTQSNGYDSNGNYGTGNTAFVLSVSNDTLCNKPSKTHCYN